MSNPIRRAVRYALLAGAASSAVTLPVVAQDQDQDQDQSVQTVVVTGSRIASRDAIAESPIVTVSSDAMVNSGSVTLDHVLNTLPQMVPGISSQSNNPSSNGRAFFDLRGLGPERNLVLIDGRRGIGSEAGSIVDINTIPASLVERVEVISGGAAAVYGADAIAGVVNFIMKKDFDGFEINTGYYVTEEGDGQQLGLDLTYGGQFADGMGRAVFNASYYDRDDMYKGARTFSAQASSTTGIFPGGGYSPGTNTPSAAAVDSIFGAGACAQNGGAAGYGFNPDGTPFCTGSLNSPFDVVGYTGPESFIATAFFPDQFSYNFEPDNILVLPMERWNLYSNISLDLGDHFQPYVQATFTNYNALQELAATPGGGFTIPTTNPFIPADLATLLASRPTPAAPMAYTKRFSALGGRTGYNNHDVWQLVAGTQGDIASTWRYDLYYTYGRAVQTEVQGGNVRVPQLQALLNAADGGASICAGGFNPFGDTQISAECAAEIGLEAKNLTTVFQSTAEAVVTGDLFELPAGPLQVAVGASWREISMDFQPDSGLQPGLVVGFNEQLPISGRLDYTDLFTEVKVPILSDLPAVKDLSFTGGFRSTDNNLYGRDDTWKLTADWSIVDSFRIRGGFQHGVRSPNIEELFSPQTNNFPNIGVDNDPCNTTGTIANDPLMGRNGANGAQVQTLCTNQAAVAGQPGFVQSFGQAQAITGGNPNLTPESADSWSAGFVYTTQSDHPALQRLTVSVDYVAIKLEEVIDSVAALTIVQRCFNRENANPTYALSNEWCQLYNRDVNDGRVIGLQTLQRNQAFIDTSGIDFTVDWGISLGERAGDLGFALIGGWIEKFETQTSVADPVNDFVGTISQVTATSTPEWKANLTTTWSLADLHLQWTMRYIDSMFHANVVTGGNPLTNTGVPETYYHDLAGFYNMTDKLTIRAGVTNVGNQQPRLYVPNVQANTDPSLYDILGRRFFLNVNMRF
jgi:iron complex outermembrane recepter protein